MTNFKIILSTSLLIPIVSLAQTNPAKTLTGSTIDFISDTQQPMMVEKIFLKPTQNIKATAVLLQKL